MITSTLVGDKVLSASEEAFKLHEKSSLGEKKASKIEYSWLEALYLLESKKMAIVSNNKPLSHEQVLKRAKKHDKKIETKLVVFTDLRKKGYIVKTALKFGAEFRVYEKGVKPGQDHAAWLLYTTRESEHLTWHEFAAKNRVATSTNKKLLLAIVDQEDDVSYYQVSWTRL